MNHNIYDSPQSELIAKSPIVIRLKHRFLCTFYILITVIVYRGIYVVLPQFAETFAAFGSELPGMTALFIWLSPAFLWFAIVSLAPLLIWPGAFIGNPFSLIMYKLSKYNMFVSFLIFTLAMGSLYLPIFTMN